MTELRDALRRATGVSESATPDHAGISARAGRIVRRRRIAYSALSLVAVVAVGFGAYQVAEGNWFGDTSQSGLPTGTPTATPTSTPAALDPIVVEAPAAGDVVTSPVTISGNADVYEATVSIRIKDSSGEVVGKTFTTATCGSGCRGDFSVDVDFRIDSSQQGTIEVYSESAETGKPMHMVKIPVGLEASPAASGDRAAIEVDSHAPGDSLTSPTIVSGTANVFEANVRIRLLDENGNSLVDTFTTATCGSGCRGDFSKRLRFSVDHEQQGTIEVFEESAETGEEINLVSIPVTLLPA